MKKYKITKTPLQLRKFPTVEVVTYIAFYALRLSFFTLIRGMSFDLKLTNNRLIAAANNIILNYIFSLFLLFFVLYCLLTENIYGYYLSIILMFHSFLFTIAIVTLTRIDTGVGVQYWFVGMAISLSYIAEMCIAMSFVYKRRTENSMTLFQKIGADPEINRVFSVRQRLQTFSIINIFIPIVTIQILYIPPSVPRLRFEYLGLIIFILTMLQHVFVYTKFYSEDVVQKKIAIAITTVKIVCIVGMLVFTIMNHSDLVSGAKVVRFVLYSDLLLLSLVFFYCLWMDTNNFGKGLKEQVMFRTRKLTL